MWKAQTLQFVLALAFIIPLTYCVTIKDVFTSDESPLTRLPRSSKYNSNGRYGPNSDTDKSLKPEEAPEANEAHGSAAVEKRCVRCYDDYDRYPYDKRGGSNYDGRGRDYDRYNDDYRHYERDYYDRDRYNRYDPYNDRDRYYSKGGRYTSRDRYDRYDRYDDRDRTADRYYGGDYDRYDDVYDPYRSRSTNRGVGYDNRGYDYRGSTGYRPWDETYRGTSGFDGAGRGYYFASGRPEYGSTSGYGTYGGYGGGGYASGWKYGGSGAGRDDYYRDRGYGGYNSYRPYVRDYPETYRTTSYLYGRPSTTTDKPIIDDNDANNNKQSSQGGGS